MKETEFLRTRNVIPKDGTDLIIGFDNGTKESLIVLLKEYHESELKKLRVTDVSRRSELLFAFIAEIKSEFADQNWDYLDFIADRVIGKQ